MNYDVCWQGLREECELSVEVLRASCREVSEEMYPLFLFRRSNISPLAHVKAAVRTRRN